MKVDRVKDFDFLTVSEHATPTLCVVLFTPRMEYYLLFLKLTRQKLILIASVTTK